MDHAIELSSDSDSGIELHPSPVARRLRVFRRQASPSSRPIPEPVQQQAPSRIPRPANSLLGPNRGRPIQLLRRQAPAPLPRRRPAPAAASASSSHRPCNHPPTPAAAAGRPQPRLTPAARRLLLDAYQARTASRHAVVPAAVRIPTRPRLITSRREPTPPPPPAQAPCQSWFVSLSEEERLLSPSPSEASTIEARPSRDASTQTSPPRSSHASTQTSPRQSASIGIQAEVIGPASPAPAPPLHAVPQPWPTASNWVQRNLAHQVQRSRRRAQQHREAAQRRLQFRRGPPPPLPRRRPHPRAPGA